MSVVFDAQQYIYTDLSPFREIRGILTQDLQCPLEGMEEIVCTSEIKEIPPQSYWKSYIPTGRKWYTLNFADRDTLTFINDQEGVRLGQLPETLYV